MKLNQNQTSNNTKKNMQKEEANRKQVMKSLKEKKLQ